MVSSTASQARYSSIDKESLLKNVLVDVAIDDAGLQKLRTFSNLNIRTVSFSEEERSLPTDLIADINFLFCAVPVSNFSQMTALELVQITSSGYTQLLDLDLTEKNIRACNARGVFDVPIAEWNIAMLINLLRNFRQIVRNQEMCVWDRSAIFQKELRGSVLGLWGYGGIGRETARLAKAMGLKVHVLVRDQVRSLDNIYHLPGTGDSKGLLPDVVFVAGQEKEFLSGLDFLVMCMPLTEHTNGIVGEAELRALPSSAYVLNPARGPLIQERALMNALQQGWIAGAALDTHYHYPMPEDHPLWKMPNVIMTPHISGSSLNPSFKTRIWDLFCQNVERYMSEKPLLNELTPSQLNGD